MSFRLQITAGGVPGDLEMFSYDFAVAVIGAAMGLALAQGHNLSIEVEPVAAVTKHPSEGPR